MSGKSNFRITGKELCAQENEIRNTASDAKDIQELRHQ
jgi:hypothetical protein